MRTLIDADNLVYIIAWNYREVGTDTEVKQSCDTFLRDILTLTQADDYIGSFSDKETFRNERYLYAPYKGERPEKPDWLKQWEPTIKEHFINKHGFVTPSFLEADDVVIAMAHFCNEASIPWVISSPDKDVKQIPGRFYDFKKVPVQGSEVPVVATVTAEQAHRNFWMSVLTGDTTDNVKGVPGLGDKKATALLDTAMDPTLQYRQLALGAYVKYFGNHYGKIIFQETVDTIMMLGPKHAFWGSYEDTMRNIFNYNVRVLNTSKGIFDV